MSVALYIPNLISYSRVIIVWISFYYMYSSPYLAASLYLLSQVILDHLDGAAARYLNQCSKFGALFDMVIDRCAMNGLFVVLHDLYPKYALPIQIFLYLHFLSICFYLVWRHVEPKALEKDFFMNTFFFGSKLFELTTWIGTETFSVLMYLLHFTDGPIISLGALFGEVRLFMVLAYVWCLPSFLYLMTVLIWQASASVLYFINLEKTK